MYHIHIHITEKDEFGINVVITLPEFGQLYSERRFPRHFEKEKGDLRKAREHFGLSDSDSSSAKTALMTRFL